jgi:VanZ family protein
VRGLLDDPWGPKPPGALIADGILYAALAFLAAYEAVPYLMMRLYGRAVSRVSAALGAVVFTAVLASALEFAQLFILGHSPGLQDVVTALIAALVGASLVVTVERDPIRPARALGELSRRLPAVVLAFAIAAPVARALSPFQLVPLDEKLAEVSAWQLVPFWALFRNVNVSTFRNVFEAALYYAPLGYVLAARGHRPVVSFAAAVALAEVLEVLQLPIAGRTYDITEGIYAGACALAGAWVLSRLTR